MIGNKLIFTICYITTVITARCVYSVTDPRLVCNTENDQSRSPTHCNICSVTLSSNKFTVCVSYLPDMQIIEVSLSISENRVLFISCLQCSCLSANGFLQPWVLDVWALMALSLVGLVYTCLDTCCSHFLTITAGVDLHFRHESELPVCRTRGLKPGRRGAGRGC